MLLEKSQPASALRALILAIGRETPYFMGFSPDGNWFLGAPNSQAIDALLYNLRSKQVVKLPGHAQEVIAHGFTFLSNDRILARGTSADKPVAVIEIPSGKIDSRIPLPPGEIRRMSNPGYALLRPFDKIAAGVIDIDSKMFVLRSNVPALDRFEDLLLCERGTGDLGLYRGTAIQSTAALQQSKLPPGAAGEFSPNLDWLTLSAATHAMIWDLAGGRSRLIRPFAHAEFGSSAELLLTATKQPGKERSLVHFDLRRGQAATVDEIPESDDTEAYSYWIGSSRVVLRQPKDAKRLAVEVQEMAVRRTLWKREFELWPLVGASLSPGVLVFSWPLDSKPVDALAKADPELKKARKNVFNMRDAWLVQLLDAANGAVKAQRIVEGVTIPFETAEAGGTTLRAGFAAAGDYLLAASTDNRLVIEHWADGVPPARTFGRAIAFDRTQGRLAVRNADTELRVLDAATGSEVRRLQFPDRIVLASFRADGRQLGVVTADQQVYLFAIP